MWLRSRVLVLLHQGNKNVGYTNHNSFKKRAIYDHRCIFVILRVRLRIVDFKLNIDTCPFVIKVIIHPKEISVLEPLSCLIHNLHEYFQFEDIRNIVDIAFSSPRDETITHGTLDSIKANEAKVWKVFEAFCRYSHDLRKCIKEKAKLYAKENNHFEWRQQMCWRSNIL